MSCHIIVILRHMFTRISLSGCGWKVFWYFGVIQKLSESGLVDLSTVEYITASAGGGAAIFLLTRGDAHAAFLEALNTADAARSVKKREVVERSTAYIYDATPKDIHTTRRLTICYTKVSLFPFKMSYVMQDEFDSKGDMFEALKSSVSIPFANDMVRLKNRILHLDAGVLCNQPSKHHETLRISAWPLSFGSDIRPSHLSLFDKYTIEIPSTKVAMEMYEEGLKDGERFSLKHCRSR